MVEATNERTSLICRLPGLVFFSLCVVSSVAGAIGFSILGVVLVTLAGMQDSKVETSFLIFMTIAGLVLPVVLLRKARKNRYPYARAADQAREPNGGLGLIGPTQSEPSHEAAIWYYKKNGAQRGPVSLVDLNSLLSDGTLLPDSMIWRDGLAQWISISQIATTVDRSARRTFLGDTANKSSKDAGVFAGSREAPGSSEPGTTWYYTEDGKRIGPVTEVALRTLLRRRRISAATSVWRKGMADWQPLSTTELKSLFGTDSPPPLAKKDIAEGYVWALALAPVWSTLLQYLLAAIYVSTAYSQLLSGQPYYFGILTERLVREMWFLGILANMSMAILDYRSLKAAGWESDRLNGWLTLLVPFYIYKRDQLLEAGMTRFWVWIGALFVSLLPIW